MMLISKHLHEKNSNWQKKVCGQKVGGGGAKCLGAEMSRGRNVLGPKRPGAEMSLGPKRPRAEMSFVPKRPGAKMSLVPKHSGRNVLCRNSSGRNLMKPISQLMIDFSHITLLGLGGGKQLRNNNNWIWFAQWVSAKDISARMFWP